MTENRNNISFVLSEKIRKAVNLISDNDFCRIQEIRLRAGKPVCLSLKDKLCFITSAGKITLETDNLLICTKSDIDETFRAICQFSLHSFQKEISQGYITLKGGNRVGLCGTCVSNGEYVETVKDIYSVNIRIAKEIIGCADGIYTDCFSQGLKSVLIIGPPSSGKTTVLRDLCRRIGKRTTISIIDERNEIAATYCGQPQNDVGLCSDIFNGYPKSAGIMTALKTMSPQVIVCDEIGTQEDVDSIISIMNCGVKIIATAHSGSVEEVLERKALQPVFDKSIFDIIVLLGTGKMQGKVIDIKRMRKSYA